MATTRPGADIGVILQRARRALSPEDRADCLREIDAALDISASALERAQLFMCRARVHSNQWQTRGVLEDALAAMALFEQAGEAGPGADAASLAAAFASRLGELSLAAQLATKSLLAIGSVDDGLVIEIANRMGIFCYSFLDYGRATQQFEVALLAAERCGDHSKVFRQLQKHRGRVAAGRARDPFVSGDGNSDQP